MFTAYYIVSTMLCTTTSLKTYVTNRICYFATRYTLDYTILLAASRSHRLHGDIQQLFAVVATDRRVSATFVAHVQCECRRNWDGGDGQHEQHGRAPLDSQETYQSQPDNEVDQLLL